MKKQIRALAMTMATLAAVTVAHSAQATVIDISSAPSAIALAPNGTAHFGDKFKNNLKNDIFADHFTFTTTGTTKLDLILTSTSTSALNGLNITGFSLYKAGGALAVAGTQVQTGATDKWTLGDANLAAGSYYVQVSGNVVSNTGGAFAGNGTISAVPEPEGYAMLFVGLGLIGLVKQRRKSARFA
ncbi:FxDxF family PEP-CTERM protein [Duganella sp. LX20W]|uniref:FxDxF family PEP-CTERM protein n=1 Tax=Rugamonas brunnea TaxID=2758569 RepID=A0A7W2IBP6_9BURK|nr:FxDxF family PEP-CTERM protein [Rugamonas brunnea]MBA5637706.1 FxDxF family PEP-CTERM protein [Rugamonas brunnea]